MAFVVEFADAVKRLEWMPVPSLRDGSVVVAWSSLAEAVDQALTRGETHYTDRPGILPLRERVTAMLKARFGLEADARSAAVITCGAVEAGFVALQQLLAPGQFVWSPDSLLERVAGAALIRRGSLASAPEEASIVYLGSSCGEQELRGALAKMATDAVVLFEVDDEKNGFHPAQIEGFAERVVTIGQIGYASWQMGYLIAPGKQASGLRDFKQALTICSTNLSQWAALAAMEAQ
jgi:aspartate/methionine/tyrosine aminotransferase